MVFYYRYLTDKYFTRLKHARFIIASYDIKVEHVKQVRRVGLLKVCLRALKESAAESKSEEAEVERAADLLAFRLFFLKPALSRLAEKRNLQRAAVWHRTAKLKAAVNTWASYTNDLYHLRKKDIIAQRRFERATKASCFAVFRNLKQIVASFERDLESRADRFLGRWRKKKLRACFDAVQSNEDERIARSRRQLKRQLMKRIVACWQQWIETVRRADGLARTRKRTLAQRILLALKTHKDQQKRRTAIFDSISARSARLLVQRALRRMSELSRHRICLNQKEARLAEETEHRLCRRSLRDWRLLAVEKIIEKKMARNLLLKKFLGLVRGRGEAERRAQEQERVVRQFTFKRRAKFLLFLLEINLEVERAKKENRLLLENKYKSMIFYGWLAQAKRQQGLKSRAAKVERLDLRLKFRLWRDLTLSKMMLGYCSHNQLARVLQAWKAALVRTKENTLLMRVVLDSNLRARALYSLKQHAAESKELRYMNVQAVAFERLSGKRKLLNCLAAWKGRDRRTVEPLEKLARKKLLARHLEAWLQLSRSQTVQEEQQARAAASWKRHRLRNSFDSLRAFARLQQHQYEQEKDAMTQHKARLKEALVKATVEHHREIAREFEVEAEARLFIKKRRVLNLVKKIGRLWVEKARRRLLLVNRGHRHRETDPWSVPDQNTSLRLAPTGRLACGYTCEVIEPVKKKEAEMAQYLTHFQKKRRLEPVGLASKPPPRQSQSSASSSAHTAQPIFYFPAQDPRTALRDPLQSLAHDPPQVRADPPRSHHPVHETYAPHRDLSYHPHRAPQLPADEAYRRLFHDASHSFERAHSSPHFQMPQPLLHYPQPPPTTTANAINELESLLEEYRLLGSMKNKTADQLMHIEFLKTKIRHLYVQVK